jgi:hypothetical protein
MTLLDHRPSEGLDREAQALFEEARQRRRRRRLVTGSVVAAVVGAGMLVLAGPHGLAGRVAPHVTRPRPLPPVAPPAPGTATGTGGLRQPEALAMAPDGGVLIDEPNRIVEREPGGSFRVIAGNGHAGLAGDGGPAARAQLNAPVAMAVRSDGTIDVADMGNNRIRAVGPHGNITTVAQVPQPTALALGPTGMLYVADGVGIQTVGPTGTLTTLVAPTASVPGGTVGDITVGRSSFAFDPDAIAVSTNGDLYVANSSPKAIIRFSPDGRSPTLVGMADVSTGQTYVTRAGLASAPGGTVVVADYGGFAIDRASGSRLTAIASFASGSLPGVRGVFRPSGVAAAPDGIIYADTDGENGGAAGPALVAIGPDGTMRVLDAGPPAPVSGS